MESVVMRVASGPRIGLGHISRCRALSRYLPDPFYATAVEGVSLLLKMGIHANRIIPIDPCDNSSSWLTNLDKASTIIFDSLVSGQQSVVEREVIAAKARGRSVVVIDSMPPDHFMGSNLVANQSDIVVTPYLGAENLRPPPRTSEWLVGSEWSILPPELLAARSQPFPKIPRILLTCGGSDPEHLCLRAAKILAGGQTNVDIIVGPDFSRAQMSGLTALAEKFSILRLVSNVNNLIPHYLSSTIIIGRPGLQRYEAAALGRHAIYFWHGNRFIDYFENFADEGLGEIFFDMNPVGWESFETRLMKLRDEVELERLSQRNTVAMEKVIGEGAKQLAHKILRLGAS